MLFASDARTFTRRVHSYRAYHQAKRSREWRALQDTRAGTVMRVVWENGAQAPFFPPYVRRSRRAALPRDFGPRKRALAAMP
jgi:hypothetical protein